MICGQVDKHVLLGHAETVPRKLFWGAAQAMSSVNDQLGPQIGALTSTLAAQEIHLSPDQVEQLDQYRRLLWSWNKQLNLTRHTTLEKFVTRDVLDSMQLAALLAPGERVLDVGTGGGVPGAILAIVRPDLAVSLAESTTKKARAVEAIVEDLGLSVPVYACRAEEALEVDTFDTLVIRAVAPLRKLLTWFAPHWEAFDRLLVIKGPNWVSERGEARHHGLLHNLELRKAATYKTPPEGAESVILKIWPKTSASGTDDDLEE
jgi:16S rRNA (guanine527-N7)-methyltransferase